MSLLSSLATIGLKLKILPYREISCRAAFIKERYTFLFIFDNHRMRVLRDEPRKWLVNNDIPYVIKGVDGKIRVFGLKNAEIVQRELVEPLSISVVVMRWRMKEFHDWCDDNGIVYLESDTPRVSPQVGDATFHLIGAENVLLLKMRFHSSSKFNWLYVIE